MASFNEPSFQDRVESAGKARQKALDQLKAKPPTDEALTAARRQAREVQQRHLQEERTAKAQERAAAKAEKAANKAADIAATEAAAALKAARLKPPSPEEMKSARDARYAARKARSSRESDIDLLFERPRDIDLADNAEALRLQRSARAIQRVLE